MQAAALKILELYIIILHLTEASVDLDRRNFLLVTFENSIARNSILQFMFLCQTLFIRLCGVM